MNKYKSIIIKRGPEGWGGPLTIVPTQVKNKILVVTTDGFPPLAKYIANLTGCELIDGFKIMDTGRRSCTSYNRLRRYC